MDTIVSIIIPCFNAESYIDETIQSVINQTYSNWELLVIDDGSTDGSADIIKKYANNDSRVRYEYQKNSGVSSARNKGIRLSKGQYIAFLDADDVWESNNLEEKITLLNTHPDIDYVFSNMYHLVLENGIYIKKMAPFGTDIDIHKELLLWEKEAIPGLSSNLIVRKECIEKHQLFFDEHLSTAADRDYAIYLSLNCRGELIDKYLLSYRIAPNSMSKNIPLMEKDFIYVYEKAYKNKLFNTFWFRQRCFSNLYWILGGSYYKHTSNKSKAFQYLLKSILMYPLKVFKGIDKLMIYIKKKI